MLGRNLYDARALTQQIHRQKKYAFDLEKDIAWDTTIDPKKFLVPLDHDAILFPSASKEQRLAISQMFGLAVNATVAEMEAVMDRLRDVALEKHLDRYPVNPEMRKLGDLFFIEEEKHARVFFRYIDQFCEDLGIDRDAMDRLLPKAFGSHFLKALYKNAQEGGQAFWWTVAVVEEVSLQFYRQLVPHKHQVESLFFQIHQKHMEEESRHHNYAFLMLELIRKEPISLKSLKHRHLDLLYSQYLMTRWVFRETSRFFDAKTMRKEHPFFDVLASALPLLRNQSPTALFKKIFSSAPYVSLILNTRYHAHTCEAAEAQGALAFPYPQPAPAELISEEAFV